jgi:broad specificity phosphatase PhoE
MKKQSPKIELKPIYWNCKCGTTTFHGKPKVTVIAMRHGESEHNIKMVVNGDPKKIFHLTAKGKKQAVEVSKKLKDKNIFAIIASEMKRTQETAAPLAKLKKLRILIDKRLNDIGAGGLEGINILEFRRLTGDVHKSVKKSENNIHVAKRIKSFLQDLLKVYNGKTIAIVTSEIILHALKQISKGQPVDELKGHHVKNGVAYTFHIHSPVVCISCGTKR